MATYITFRDGGRTNELGMGRMASKLWSGNVLEGLTVSAANPLSMNVVVAAGDLKIDTNNSSFYGWSDSDETVSVAVADVTNPRIDRVVAYIDTLETPNNVNANNPGLLKFTVVAGAPAATPEAPTDSDVQQELGSGVPWCDLAAVNVPASTTQITVIDLTDTRTKLTTALRTTAHATYDFASLGTHEISVPFKPSLIICERRDGTTLTGTEVSDPTHYLNTYAGGAAVDPDGSITQWSGGMANAATSDSSTTKRNYNHTSRIIHLINESGNLFISGYLSSVSETKLTFTIDSIISGRSYPARFIFFR